MKLYYVVHKGRVPGIYSSWPECKKQIDGFDGAIFKKFVNETEAQEFLKIGFGKNKVPKIVTRRKNEDEKNSALIEKETEDIPEGESCLFIYTDGSFIKSPNKLPKAGYGIYISSKNIRISKPLLNQKITNNRAELTAIIESISYLNEDELKGKICIFTDSQYSMYIFNGTGERYEKNDYKNEGKDVPNIDLIKKILEIKRTYNIVLLKVRAHTDKKDKHSIGNEIADKLANDGALGKNKKPGEYDDKEDADLKSYLNNMKKIQHISCEQSFIKVTDDKINPEIQMNDLFEFSELNDINKYDNSKSNSKKKKNSKLTEWFFNVPIGGNSS